MRAIVYYRPRLRSPKVLAVSKDLRDGLPDEKQRYWLEKLGRGKLVLGTAIFQYTGKMIGG